SLHVLHGYFSLRHINYQYWSCNPHSPQRLLFPRLGRESSQLETDCLCRSSQLFALSLATVVSQPEFCRLGQRVPAEPGFCSRCRARVLFPARKTLAQVAPPLARPAAALKIASHLSSPTDGREQIPLPRNSRKPRPDKPRQDEPSRPWRLRLPEP